LSAPNVQTVDAVRAARIVYDATEFVSDAVVPDGKRANEYALQRKPPLASTRVQPKEQ
jgi:hypothetical protein